MSSIQRPGASLFTRSLSNTSTQGVNGTTAVTQTQPLTQAGPLDDFRLASTHPVQLSGNTGGSSPTRYPEPQWLSQGQCPPWMNPQTWTRMAPRDRLEVQVDLRQKWTQHLEALRPESVASDDPAWQDFAQQEQQFYFEGVPQGGAPSQGSLVALQSGESWGQGQTGPWATYHGTAIEDAAQMLDIGTLLEWPGGAFTHGNLCGQLSAMSAMGLGLQEGLQAFDELQPGVLDDGARTDSNDLEDFFQQQGWEILGEGASPDLDGGVDRGDNAYFNNHLGAQPTPQLLRDTLESGASLLVLVNIDGANDGLLSNPGTSPIVHWVNVVGISETATGEAYVRVYNPYHNREEVYSWDEFQAAWSSPVDGQGNTESGFTYVAARPPAES